jgi:flavin reductase (DIM6/NTAB) family NADH-FMN oxidoreductase RutF
MHRMNSAMLPSKRTADRAAAFAAFAVVAMLLFGLVAGAAAGTGDAGGGKRSLGARTLAQPCPVWVIGSYDKSGAPNVMTASWTGICCSRPPCIAVSLRSATYTHGNISANGAFTVNVPSERYAREAAYFGSVSGRDTDKFAATGLTPVPGDSVSAPYVEEFPLVIECRLLRTIELGLHTMFIGEIVSVKADEAVLGEDGTPDIEKLRPILFAPGNDDFFAVGGSIGSTRELAGEVKR